MIVYDSKEMKKVKGLATCWVCNFDVTLFLLCVALFVFGSCGGDRSVKLLPHLDDTPYQQDSILVTYAVNPDWALTLLDSALLLGNVSDYRGQFIRARIYSMSLVEQHQDTAILTCKALLSHDSVRHELVEQENTLDMLITASRAKQDKEQYLHWATQKAEAASRLKNFVIVGCLLLFVVAVAVSVYYYRKNRIISEKNRVLARMIDGLPPELPDDNQKTEPGSTAEVPTTTEGTLFHDIDTAIRTERLYTQVSLQRQDIIDRFGIGRHALNDLITAHTGGMSFPQYINAIRIEEAKGLLDSRPDMTFTAIAEAVGFTPANLREQFKRCYGMTLAEYRKQREEL